jgi:hypothetical protein
MMTREMGLLPAHRCMTAENLFICLPSLERARDRATV